MSLIIRELIRLIYVIKSITWRTYCVERSIQICFLGLINKEREEMVSTHRKEKVA
jgi:hypothetical protein